MTDQPPPPSIWSRLPVTPRAVVCGLVIGLAAANVWPLLLIALGALPAALAEVLFLAVYVWWAGGGGPPRRTRLARATAFRTGRLGAAQWTWGLIAAVAFAVTVHAALVVLFRLVPFPAEAFHQGYDLSFIPDAPLRWLAVIVSAASAGICEETGFRGYMQQPIERRHGPIIAIAVSTVLFTLMHLNKSWSTAPMVPIVAGAGLLLGLMAWASGSLIPGMIGHTLMDVGLFAFWWTGVAGQFSARPVGQTGVDMGFLLACAALLVALLITLTAIGRLRRLGRPEAS
jgi:membrane protease YdiL (CAAX protease family)